MTAQAPQRPLHPVVWVLAGILVLCTLTALWVTAARVKANKLAARYGSDKEPAPVEPRLGPFALQRGRSVPVQHLTLVFGQAGLEIHDAQGRTRAIYSPLTKGLRFGWQELRLMLLEATKDDLLIDAEFIPGAASFGPGVYLDLRAGLRVEFPHGRALTLIAWDPAQGEGKIKVEQGDRSEEHPLSESSVPMGLRWTFQKQGGRLILEDLE